MTIFVGRGKEYTFISHLQAGVYMFSTREQPFNIGIGEGLMIVWGGV